MTNALDKEWEFWIDVGGTFTDCIFRCRDGSRGELKTLSSGAIKGSSTFNMSAQELSDPLLRGRHCQNFFRGYELHFIDSQGAVVEQRTVESFDSKSGVLTYGSLKSKARTTAYELRSPESSPLVAVRLACDLRLDATLPNCELKLGTTRGTNALLTRRGAKTALVVTRGFRDLLMIGDQTRPDLFKLQVRKPTPLSTAVLEVDERVLFDGTVEKSLDLESTRRGLQNLADQGIESIAVCLLHGFRFGQHEQLIAGLARQIGFKNISLSSQVAPVIKLVNRAETTLVDAYLNPLLVDYLGTIQNRLTPQSRMLLMTSAGTLVQPAQFTGKESILSGPAGGVVGMARAATSLGIAHAIGFDMGGTSTDVSRFDGTFSLEYETRKAGVRIYSPVMAIETVAAGGGSICKFDGTRLLVGPESAGADPGPAAYGRSGPLTITDVNIVLGRLHERLFPFPLDRSAIEDRLSTVTDATNRALGTAYQPIEIAAGFLKIANSHMATAVHTVSVAKGFDARNYTLVGFGGAAAQHICAVAEELQIRRAVVHPLASVLSAYGIGHAANSVSMVKSILCPFSDFTEERCASTLLEMRSHLANCLASSEETERKIGFRFDVELRYAGTESYLSVPLDDTLENLESLFQAEHQRQFGHTLDRPIELGAIHGFASEQQPDSVPASSYEAVQPHVSAHTTSLVEDGVYIDVELHLMHELTPGDYIDGPAQIVDPFTTLNVDRGWRAIMASDRQIVLERVVQKQAGSQSTVTSRNSVLDAGSEADTNDPFLLEVLNNRLQAIANQMGHTLQRTSCSVNVKERLDFSCAIFNASGDLVVSAQHIPVHLGAMSETVKATIRLNPDTQPGDVFVTNDPFQGGSHLPDVTVITPVFVRESDRQPFFYVASRSHHAEIGGLTPGSMPPDSKVLEEEGVLISNFRLFHKGTSQVEELLRVLTTAAYPSRSPQVNLTDISAQVAANRNGMRDLVNLVEMYGRATIEAFVEKMFAAAAAKARAAIQRLPSQRITFADSLDNGLLIRLTVQKLGDRLELDFSGSSPTSHDNHNANRGIVAAAIMYVMRCLIDEEIPLNQGLLAPIEIKLPICFLNPLATNDPKLAPAVAAGNVETSQRIVDVLLGALGEAAASQGTMNNLIFGDDTFGYYETIGGGVGATRFGNGADAVHSHMTNTRLTDPEIMEANLPVIVRDFSVRRGSGGAGLYRGGNGLCRTLEFTRPLSVTLVTNRRGHHAPFGLHGGMAGKPGRNILLRRGGNGPKDLDAKCTIFVNPGDRLTIETPGGGGFGKPS